MSWGDDYSNYRHSYNDHGGYPSSRYMPSHYPGEDYYSPRHSRRDPYSHGYIFPDGTGPIRPGPGLSNRRSSHSSGSRQLARLGRMQAHYGGDCYGSPRLHGSHSYDGDSMMGYGRRGLSGGRRGYGGYGGGYDSVYD